MPNVNLTTLNNLQATTVSGQGGLQNILNVNVVSGGGSGSSNTSITVFYTVTTAFSGASVGDTIAQTDVLSSVDGSIVSTTWTNVTKNTTLSGAPPSANIVQQSSSPLTDAQLRATPVPVIVTSGGSGGSGTAGITVIDSNPAGTLVNPVTGGQGNLFTAITSTSTGSPVITYYLFGTTTVATPVGNVYPYTTEYGQTSIVGNGVMAAVKASSTSPVTTDPSLVVSLSPNGGQATAALQTVANTINSDSIDFGQVSNTNTYTLNNTNSKGTLTFQATGTWVGSVVIEITLDTFNWVPTTYVPLTSGNPALSFSSPTAGQINVVGAKYIRFRSSTVSSGTVNITSIFSRNVATIMLDNSLPTGSNNIGSINNITGTVPLPTGAASATAQSDGSQKTQIVGSTGGAQVGTTTNNSLVGLNSFVTGQQVIPSTVNSTTTQLAASATFTGAWEAVLNTASLQLGVISDQPVTITINQATTSAGNRVISSKTFTRLANQPFGESILVVGSYAQVVVQNTGAATTTTLAVSTIYTPVMSQSPVAPDNYGNMPVGISQSLYGTTNAVYVGGTSQAQVTPTVTSGSAYVAGNVVGGLLSFANAVNSTALSGVLESITVAVKSLQTASFKLYVFKSIPSTTFTDKTAPAITTTDAANLLDVFSFTTPDNGLGSNVTLYASDSINRSLVLGASTMYAVLITLGTPTFTSASDVVVTVSTLRD